MRAIACNHWAEGGAGAAELARVVTELCGTAPNFKLLYPDEMPLEEKIRTIATQIYGAATVTFEPAAAKQLREFTAAGFAALPVCMAKTQYSFSADATLHGAPEGFTLNIREVRLSAGAQFIVALCGQILTMPGLPAAPPRKTTSLTPPASSAAFSDATHGGDRARISEQVRRRQFQHRLYTKAAA